MEERVSSTSPTRNIGVMLWTQLESIFTQRNEERNSIRRMKYLELAFYSNSVYISGKPLYAERGIIQQMHPRNALPGMPCIPVN